MSLTEVIIYTDGACSGNPGPGGWGALLRHNGREKVLSGGEAHTTNNRMEMMAVIEAIRAIKKPCLLKIHSDSALIINAMTKGWLESWQSKGWKKADKKPVENRDLWVELLNVIGAHQVEWVKVRGHSGIPDNERVDQIAVQAAKQFM
tara:strand:+ start:5037 stop:5480 length:444 start_codon:yes stop_codon:yes gene_type:complete